MPDKQTLRKTYLTKRLTLTDEEYAERNNKIVTHAVKFITERKCQNIHIFLPIQQKKEVNTYAIIDHFKAETDIRFIIPKTIPHNGLEHYVWNDRCIIELNRWGIPEPVAGDRADISSVDVIFVPLVIADKNGHRIGYGKGYYDRFLKDHHALKAGLSLQPPLDEILPIEDSDIRLDLVISPDHRIR